MIARASAGGRWMGHGGRSSRWRAVKSGQLGGAVVARARPVTLPMLRVVLGVVFVWFGVLKVAGASPVGDLVARTLPWIPADVVLPVLGGIEVLLGVALMTGLGLRLVVLAMCLHLAGTFLTFLMAPALMFQRDNPLLLTADGEFVMKNLVLITAGLVLLTHVDRPRAGRRRAHDATH